jgi:hypothetical protein
MIMSEYQAHYPDFNVLHEEEHWDPHTREIVTKRLKTESFSPHRFLTRPESDTLFRLCTFLLDDDRSPVISYVVHHFDTTLQSGIGESQRKIGIPQQSTLIRKGLKSLDLYCIERYGQQFISLKKEDQQDVIQQLIQGNITIQPGDTQIPFKDWVDKIFTEAVAAYYSHPTIWSEIGYAGPAYPRGYVRSELGLTDPWEATRDGK